MSENLHLVMIVLDGGLGGHTRTAVSIAKAMRRRGHSVRFLIGSNSPDGVVAGAGFEYDRVPHGWRSELARKLEELRVQGKCDAIHIFSTLGIVEMLSYARKHQVPWVYTRCGGPPVKEPLEVRMMKALAIRAAICFSEENRQELMARTAGNPDDIVIIPARVDVEEIREAQDSSLYPAFFKKYGIQDSARIILRVARIGPHYYESVLDGMRMAESLHQRGLDVCFVHIGYADVPSLADEVYAFAKTVNDRAGKVIAVSASDESQVALKYFAMASVVVGTGRSAFEGMSLGKPTMIVGKLGFAGPVDPDHLPAQAQYNYSGRNADGSQTKEAYQAEYDETMYRVLSDPHYAAQLGQYAFDHVLNTLDVSISVPIYEARYRAYRTEWMSTPSELRRASMYSWIKRGLRNMMSKSFRAQVSSMINLRQKKAA